MVDLTAEEVGVRLELVNTAHTHQRTDETPTAARVLTGAAQMVRVLRQLFGVIRRTGRPACVHINTSGSMGLIRDVLLLLGCLMLRQRAVLHIRFGRTPEVLASHSAEKTLLRMGFRLADATICLDEPTYAAVARLIGPKAVLIPNFIQVERYSPDKGQRSRTVLFLGSVGHSKGIDELIQAWHAVRPDGWVLRLVGPLAPSYSNVAWQESLDESIDVAGPMEHADAMKELGASAALVLPSHTEGFPNVLLEAMASGTPVIASNVGAIPTMLADGAGALVPAKDVMALADALRGVLNDEKLRKAMAEKALRRVRSQYATAPVMRQYQSVWRVQPYAG